MPIAYIEPLSRAWERMKQALFKPFDFGKWFTIGFTAFLANLLENGGNGGGSNWKKEHANFGDILEAPYQAWDWLLGHAGWMILILFGGAVALAIFILLVWLSSRGKFMFLDNVAKNQSLVSRPWREFKKHGHSLFLWRLVFGIICLTLIFTFLGYVWKTTYKMYWYGDAEHFPLLFLIQMGLLFLFFILAFAYIGMLLNDFVVPVMYKHNLTATEAWNRFLPLHWRHFTYFLLYGLFILVLHLAVVALVVMAGLFTCCFGFLLLAIPYIGSVVTLPISYTFRAFSLEFLAQYGEEYNVSGRPE